MQARDFLSLCVVYTAYSVLYIVLCISVRVCVRVCVSQCVCIYACHSFALLHYLLIKSVMLRYADALCELSDTREMQRLSPKETVL